MTPSVLQHRISRLFPGRGDGLVREGLWVAVGQFISVCAILVSIRVLTELLRPDEFGRLNLLMGVSTLVLGLTATPWLQGAIRYYPECCAVDGVNVLRQITIKMIAKSVGLSCILILVGWVGADYIYGEKAWVGLLVIAILLVDVARSIELALFNAARRQRVSAIIQAADAWARPLFAIVAVVLIGASAEVALSGYIAGSALVVFALYQLSRVEGGIGRKRSENRVSIVNTELLKTKLKHYTFPLLPLAVFGWVSGMGDRYVIGGILGVKEVGLYAAAYGLASRPFLIVSGIIEQTIRPVLQNAIEKGDFVEIKQAKLGMLASLAGLAVVGVLSFCVLKDVAARILLAEDYRVAADLMPWIALGYGLYIISNGYSRLCYAFDATYSILALTALGAVIGVAVLVPAMVMYGLKGAVLAVPVRFGIELIMSFILARKAERRYTMTLVRDGDEQI